jgi:Ca-activated chloride channel family protein
MLALQTPLFLLLLLPLAVLGVAAGRALGGSRAKPRRRRVALILRLSCLLLLILALAQPVWRRTLAAGSPVIFVADTSASISPAGRAAEAAWLHAVLQRVPTGTQDALVTFAGTSMLTSVPAHVNMSWLQDRLAAGNDAGATNLEQALRLALGALPGGGRIVLLSDGIQTAGDVQQVLPLASARHATIDTVVLSTGRAPDAAMTRFSVPQRVHEGDQIPLQMTVWSARAATAKLSVQQDGHVIGSQSVRLRAGNNPLLVNLVATTPGWHSYRASISVPGDAVPQNNALSAVTDVSGPPQVLVVTAHPRKTTTVPLLQPLGLALHTVQPPGLPAKAPQIAAYDAVVLDDLPAADLQPQQVSALEQAVRGDGVGLFVVGGPHSLTSGRYGQTPLEKMLPVYSDTPNSLQKGNVALELVLDRSGSMNDLAGEYPKILMAQRAAALGVDFAAQHQDDLGLVAFDYYVHLLFPMQKMTAASSRRVHRIISAMTAYGGTNIYAALKLGLSQVLHSNAPYKHIILMTDGRSDPANYTPLLQAMQRDQVTLSTIGLGQDADVNLLHYLAARAKGRFYYTNNAADLPRIFAQEARLSAGDAQVTGDLGVAIAASSPLIRSLNAGALPHIKGYVATVLKPTGVADLVVHAKDHSADPVLAHWQYGLGRIAVWTPGSTAAWAATWATNEPGLWNDTVRWLAKPPAVPVLTPQLQTGADLQRLVVDTQQTSGTFVNLALLQIRAQGPSGRALDLPTTEVGPGLYTAVLSPAQPGVYAVSVRERSGSLAPVHALVAVPYPREYLPAASDPALLSQLAVSSGGRMLTAPGQFTDHSGGGQVIVQDELWWPLAALALLVFLFDVVLRQSEWGVLPSA